MGGERNVNLTRCSGAAIFQVKHGLTRRNQPGMGLCLNGILKKRRLFTARMPWVRSMLKIVLIEEDIAMQALITEWLTQAGYQVEASRRPAAAPLGGVALVIADLPKLREGDAPHARVLRASYPGAAFIGLSAQMARSLLGSSDRAKSLGVAALLSKPCTSSELLAAVAGAIGPAC